MANAICSIVSNNYFGQVQTLCKSIQKIYGSDMDVYVLIVDKPSPAVRYDECPAKVLFASQLGIPDFDYLSMKYNVIEFNTYVKPFLLMKLLKDHEKVLYIDPDIVLFDRLDGIFSDLDSHPMVLSPHKLTRLDSGDDNEFNIIKAGFFNLGFCGVNNTPKALEILNAWNDELYDYCYSNVREHMFTDQKWISNLFFYYYKDMYVCPDPGVNFAPWNFCERTLSVENGKPYVSLKGSQEKSSLKFFHFSGFDVHGGDNYFTTKHAPIEVSDATLRDLLVAYRAAILANHFDEYHPIPYAYNYFSNGRYISRFERCIFDYWIKNGFLDKSNNYFSSDDDFYKLLKKNHVLTKDKIASTDLASPNVLKKGTFSKKENAIKSLMKMAKRTLGITNYAMLLKYLSFASAYSNQTFLLNKKSKKN
jgi:hypothetical protein